MSLYKRPLTSVLESVKALNNVDLVEVEYTYGNPVPVTPETGGVNTTMLVTALNPGSPYDGDAVLRYVRLNLADLLVLVPATLRVYQPVTTTDIALRLNQLYGTNFTTDDIVESPLSLTAGVGPVTLVAKTNSRGWIGQVTFNVEVGARPISIFITTVNLPGLMYPDVDIEKPYGPIYSYWRDFSPVRDVLDTVVVGIDSLPALRGALATVTADTWQLTGQSRYSLDTATVEYADVASGHPLANPDYDKVVVVALDPVKCLGLSGKLVLNYRLAVVE